MRKFLLLLLFCSNTYLAFSNATVTQKGWRWRNDDGTETSASWRKSKNVALTNNSCERTDALRLRITFEVGPDQANPGFPAGLSVSSKLSYATDPAGPFTVIPESLTSGEHFEMHFSNYITPTYAGTSTTQQNSSGRFSPGLVIDDSTCSGNANFSTPSDKTSMQEYEWVFVPTSNAQLQTYYFKLEGLSDYDGDLPELTLSGAICTGITDQMVAEKTKVYPNPVSKNETVSITSTDARIEKITLYDKFQKQLMTTTNAADLNLQDLEAGMYLLEIVTNRGVAMKKFMVE